MVTQTTDTAPAMTPAELNAALRDRDSALRLTDEECRYALIWLRGYTKAYGKRGTWTTQAIAQAVKSQLDNR